MDPLSITANVVGITTTCLATIKALNDLRTKFREAALTLAAICSESAVISATLSRLQSFIMSQERKFLKCFEDRMELVATFDIALLGCVAVFSCLQEEIGRITRGMDNPQIGKFGKIKMLWREDVMQELLRQIRCQQVAISLPIQILQM